MLHTGITGNDLDDIYFFDMKKSTYFIDYIDSFNKLPTFKQSILMIPMFKWELYDNPGKLHPFFEHYDEFVKRILKIQDQEMMYLITSQHFGIFSILADHDKTGEKTVKVMKKDPLKSNLLNSYDDLYCYGPIMNLFSDFMKYRGKKLTKLLRGEYLNKDNFHQSI